MNRTSIEFFSGSKVVSEVLSLYGFTTFTIDSNPLLYPSICCDILDFNTDLVPGQLNFFWASPDCRKFSRDGSWDSWQKETIGYRQYRYTPTDLEAARSYALLAKTISLINFFKPDVWFIENPVGRIQHMEPLQSIGHYRYGINYKDYGFDYSKETYLFTNMLLPLSTKKVIRPGKGVMSLNSKYKRAVVPPALLHFLIQYIYE
jgi:site-specific DNA-cytosine methylase